MPLANLAHMPLALENSLNMLEKARIIKLVFFFSVFLHTWGFEIGQHDGSDYNIDISLAQLSTFSPRARKNT